MKRKYNLFVASLLVFSLITSFFSTLPTASAQSPSPTTQPLLQKSNLTLLGSFKLPNGGGTDNSGYAYSGESMAYNPANNSLFLVGHDWYQMVGEVSIPSSFGGTASTLQPLTDAFEGKLGSINPGDPNSKKAGALLVHGGKLYISGWSFYDGALTQNKSIFVRPISLSTKGQVQGAYRVGSTYPGWVNHYAGTIPSEWQSLLGGQAFVGGCCAAIIAGQSLGPSVSAINPADVGVKDPVPASLLLGYPISNATLGGCTSVDQLFNCATSVTGVVFPANTRSVLFFGKLGSGGICYKDEGPAGCRGSGGYQAERYSAHVWAYDANDLLAVKNGTKQYWQVTPYATWTIDGVGSNIRGAAYDPATQRVYLEVGFTDGEKPTIAVLQINNTATAPVPTPTPTPTPDPAPTPTPSTKFVIGDSVQATANLNVRGTANTSGALLGTQNIGATGTVVAGPISQGGYSWWQINYATGADGWSVEDFLVKYTALAPTPTPTPTPTTGTTVNVSTVSQLQSAISNLQSGQTILIAPGTYNLTSTLYIPQNRTGIAIKGSTGNRSDVVIRGGGMSSGLNFGFWADNVNGLTISDLTIRDFREHGVIANGGVDNIVYRNIHVIDIGDQFLKHNPSSDQLNGVDNGILENSILEYTNTAPDTYTNGLDVHRGKNWIVRGNTFKNFRASSGLAGPAVLIWNGSSDTTVERNTFINNQRDISLGLDSGKTIGTTDHARGIISNNFIYKTSSVSPDVAVAVFDSPNTKVYYNTILAGGYPNAIEYRFSRTTGVDIKNNLVSGNITARDGATGSVSNNVSNATASMFVNAPAGDLHLVSGATTAIDKGVAVSVTTDFDGQSRPVGSASDVGADEFNGTVAPTPIPEPTPTPDPVPEPTPTPNAKFIIGDSIQTTATIAVRSSAGGTRIGRQIGSSQGSVVSGPVRSSGINWWNIDYASGVDGWSAEDYLIKATESPKSNKFIIGDSIQTTVTIAVRSSAGGTRIGRQVTSSVGTITGGSIWFNSYHWWNVNFNSGVDGWVAEDYINKFVIVPTPEPTPTPDPEPTPVPEPTPTPTDATVSAWSAWTDTSAWTTCTSGTQTKTQQRTRTVLQPATNGGSTPALTETQTVSQSCTVAVEPTTPTTTSGQTLLTTQTPVLTDIRDGVSVNYELGMRFKSNTAGQIVAIRFYKSPKETGTHTGRIWDNTTRAQLASVVFTNETASGWQEQKLSSPLNITAGKEYTVTVNTGNAYYVVNDYGFSSTITNGNLSLVGSAGRYGSVGVYPAQTWKNSNYFRDVVFVPGSSVTPTPTPDPEPTPIPEPTPTPTDATVSAWSAWTDTSGWTTCTSGTQTKTQQRTRTVLQPATNGGSTPALTETQTVSQSCTVAVESTSPTPSPTQPGTPSSVLVQKADIQYIGSFSLPNANQGDLRFGYGGGAVGYHKDSQGRDTLYMEGHAWYKGNVAQVQIPSNLSTTNRPTAILLQKFRDISEGKLGGVDGDGLGSLLSYNNRLIVGSYIYYDGSGSQQGTVGVSGFDLNQTGDFKGYFDASGINPGRLGKYMTTIPAEWQSALGGSALSGACCLSIISRTSTGPSVSVFNPDDVGNSGNSVNYKQVLGYDLTNNIKFNGQTGGCSVQSTLFNCTTSINAVAFPAGTKTVLFFGTQGTGPVCYKDEGPAGCRGTGGYNAPPYVFQVWAYDVNDLVAVKNGSKQPWQVAPYAIWQMDFGFEDFEGGAFDPATNRVFLVEKNGEDPIVRVLKINAGTPGVVSTINTTSDSNLANVASAIEQLKIMVEQLKKLAGL